MLARPGHILSGGGGAAPAQWPGVDLAAVPPHPLEFPTGMVTVPLIDSPALTTVIAKIGRARRFVEHCSAAEILHSLDACAAAWCERGDPFRQAALEWLGRTTGCAAAMLSPALTATFDALRSTHVHALVAHECGGLDALDAGITIDGRRQRAVGPRLTWVIGAGIVPNAIAVPVFAALMCKSAVLVKTPRREPIFGALLAASLEAVDPKLGACVAAGWWPGDSNAHTDLAAAASDAIIVTGTNDTVRTVEQRATAGTRVIGYGDRVSVIAIGRERLTDAFGDPLWLQVAEAVGWYEQQGCLSPQVVYIEEGGELAPRQAAERLADAMALYEGKAPRGPVSAETAAALRTHRERAEVRAVDGARAAVWASMQTPPTWVVTFDADARFVRSPGGRFIHVRPVYDLEDLPTLLRKADAAFQAVGLEVDDARRELLAEAFRSLDVSRLCPVAELQRPPVDWPRDGRPVLSTLLRWIQA